MLLLVLGLLGYNFETRYPGNDSDQVWFKPWPSSFRGEDFWKSLRTDGRQTDDGWRTTDRRTDGQTDDGRTDNGRKVMTKAHYGPLGQVSYENVIQVTGPWHLQDWHVPLPMYLNTKYSSPMALMSYWETDLTKKMSRKWTRPWKWGQGQVMGVGQTDMYPFQCILHTQYSSPSPL